MRNAPTTQIVAEMLSLEEWRIRCGHVFDGSPVICHFRVVLQEHPIRLELGPNLKPETMKQREERRATLCPPRIASKASDSAVGRADNCCTCRLCNHFHSFFEFLIIRKHVSGSIQAFDRTPNHLLPWSPMISSSPVCRLGNANRAA